MGREDHRPRRPARRILELLDVGEEEAVGALAAEDHPPVRDRQAVVRCGQRLIGRQDRDVREIRAFSVELGLACPQDRLEGVADVGGYVLVGVQRLHCAPRRVVGKRHALKSEFVERSKVDVRGDAARSNFDRRAFAFVEIDFDETLDQREVDLMDVDDPARKADAPDEFERLVAAAHLGELRDLEETLVERQGLADRTLGDRPGKPRQLNPSVCFVRNFGTVFEAESDIPLGRSRRRGDRGSRAIFVSGRACLDEAQTLIVGNRRDDEGA